MLYKRETDMKVISTQRSFIMGIAILWVAWFHTDLEVSIPGVAFLRQIGYGGVDLFFLMSGIGAIFSLSKNPDPVSYMKNRAKRILPSYYPFIIVWIVMMKITGEVYGTEIIGNLTMMGWWCEGRNQFNWYTNAIWLFYLLAPVLVGVISKAQDSRKRFVITLFFMAAGFIASMTFWHTLLLTAFSRLPLFVLGICLGQEMMDINRTRVVDSTDVQEESSNEGLYIWQKYPKIFWNVLMAGGVVSLYVCLIYFSGDLWTYGLWWYPFVLITPGLAMDLGLLAEWLKKSSVGNGIVNGMNVIGDASFEIFLWHIGVFEFVKPRYNMNALTWTILLATVVVWSIGYRKLVQRVFKLK